MATVQVTVILVAAVLLAAVNNGGVGAQSPAPAPATTDCLTSIVNMSDCLTFVEKGSKLTVPEKPCCGELAGLVESNPICLCYLLGNSNSFGVEIDGNKALSLPSVCNVVTPPVSTCSLLGIPVGSPTSSDAPMSPGEQPPGTDGAPSTGNKDGNGVSSIADSSLAFLVGLAIAFIPSFF